MGRCIVIPRRELSLALSLVLGLLSCSATPPHAAVDQVLHELADDFKALSVERAMRHFSPGSANLEAELRDRFGKLSKVEKSKFFLDELRPVDGGYEADVFFMQYGYDAKKAFVGERSQMVFYFEPRPGEDDGWQICDQRIVEASVTESEKRGFVERSAEVGLAMEHQRYRPIEASTPVIPGNFSGAGVSALDLDGDHFLEVLVGDGKQVRLFQNLANGRFRDITEQAGLTGIGAVRGAYFFDYDADGAADILFTRAGFRPVIYRQVGAMRFELSSEVFAGLPDAQYESVAFGDLDNDGDLDIYFLRYGDFYTQSWAYPIYESKDGPPDLVLENLGGGRFREVQNAALTPPGWGLGVALADYDGDNDLDVYIVNDFGSNHLIRNDGNWQFTEVTEAAGVGDQGFGMGAAFGDYDGDGDLDIYVANMTTSVLWIFEDPDFPLPLIADLLLMRDFVKEQMRKAMRGNSLFRNDGDGTFTHVARHTRTDRAQWAWGANFCDYDNDGDLDIYSPNGYITGKRKKDC